MPVTNLQHADFSTIRQTVRQAGEVLASGGLVIFPTETVYGIGASVASDRGWEALREIKGRPDQQPFTLHLPSAAAAEIYADFSSPMLRRFVRKVFPGPVTLVVDVSDDRIAQTLAKLNLPAQAAERLYHQNTIGLRCPDHPVALQVLGSLEAPIVVSSANKRGEPPPQDCEAAVRSLGAAADLVIDGGPCQYAKPSTVVRVQMRGDVPTVKVLRAGVYDERTIYRLLRWTLLLVCSGNTCRSPMAEELAKLQLAQARGIKPDELTQAGIYVQSAGTAAGDGMPASGAAVEALRQMGAVLEPHRSRMLNVDMLRQADVVLCMTREHRASILRMEPSTREKVFLLDSAGDVPDPIGSGVEDYLHCARRIDQALKERLKEYHP